MVLRGSWMVAFMVAGCAPKTEVVFECDRYSCVPEGELPKGDPAAGRDRVVNKGTNSCGLPYSVYDLLSAAFDRPTLPDKTGLNEGLPYNMTAGVSPRGVDVASGNCLSCHASMVDGEVVIGRGNAFGLSTPQADDLEIARALTSDPAEIAEIDAVLPMVEIQDRYVSTTMGGNRGDAAVFAAAMHRDPETLAFLDEPLDTMLPTPPLPVDPPPWWGMAKKRAMFWNTAARGDFSNFVLNGAMICADDVEWAEELFADAVDVRAWVQSIEAPRWPYGIDEDLAADGEEVFRETCARCHGTYDEEGEYPNVVVPVDVVGTDRELADLEPDWDRLWDLQMQHNVFGEGVSWDPQVGYIAPPLDGIWASAPYFHNGSVPTVAAVLDSSRRPDSWRHLDLDGGVYDKENVGWKYEVPEVPKAEASEEDAPYIYDTSFPGYGNGGHPFGDALTDEDRTAVIEYLKTL